MPRFKDSGYRRSSLGNEPSGQSYQERAGDSRLTSEHKERRKSSLDFKAGPYNQSKSNPSRQPRQIAHLEASVYGGHRPREPPGMQSCSIHQGLDPYPPALPALCFSPAFPHSLVSPLLATPNVATVLPPYGQSAPYTYACNADPRLHLPTPLASSPQMLPISPVDSALRLRDASPPNLAPFDSVDLPNPWSEAVDGQVTPPLFEPKPSKKTRPPSRSALKGGRRASSVSMTEFIGQPPDDKMTNDFRDIPHRSSPEIDTDLAESPSARLFEGVVSLGSPSATSSGEEKALFGSKIEGSADWEDDITTEPLLSLSPAKSIQDLVLSDPDVKAWDLNNRKEVQVRGGALWQYCAAESAELVLGEDLRFERLSKELADLERERDEANAFITQLKGLLMNEEKKT